MNVCVYRWRFSINSNFDACIYFYLCISSTDVCLQVEVELSKDEDMIDNLDDELGDIEFEENWLSKWEIKVRRNVIDIGGCVLVYVNTFH